MWKRIKNYLRNSLGGEKLNAFSFEYVIRDIFWISMKSSMNYKLKRQGKVSNSLWASSTAYLNIKIFTCTDHWNKSFLCANCASNLQKNPVEFINSFQIYIITNSRSIFNQLEEFFCKCAKRFERQTSDLIEIYSISPQHCNLCMFSISFNFLKYMDIYIVYILLVVKDISNVYYVWLSCITHIITIHEYAKDCAMISYIFFLLFLFPNKVGLKLSSYSYYIVWLCLLLPSE